MGEIVLIAVVALLVLGPDRLPSAAKALGKGIRDLRASTRDLQTTIEKDTHIGDAVRELRGALRGDPEHLYKKVTGEDFHAPPKKEREGDNKRASDDPVPGSSDSAVGDEKITARDDSDKAQVQTDSKLGALLDEAYENRDDGWGEEPVNPHDGDPEAEPESAPVLTAAKDAISRDELPPASTGEPQRDDSGNG